MQWETITVSEGGKITIKEVYGYYYNLSDGTTIFIACDPSTGEFLDKAYVPAGEIGKLTERKLTGKVKGPDFKDFQKMRPVVITNVFAPNIHTGWKYYNFLVNGQLLRQASGAVCWPGPINKSYLVPDTDPDYFLIVAEVHNPNNFPVKAKVDVQMHTLQLRKDFWEYPSTKVINKQVEVSFGPNETKYILLNRESVYGLFGYDWDSESYFTYYYSWAKMLECQDAAMPDDYKPSYGWFPFLGLYYGLGTPEIYDLERNPELFQASWGLELWRNYGEWRSERWFKGQVSYGSDGWKATWDARYRPGDENLAASRERLVSQYFNDLGVRGVGEMKEVNTYSGDGVPYNVNIGGSDLKVCIFVPSGFPIEKYAYQSKWDQTGPVMIRYDKDWPDINRSSVKWYTANPGYVGWTNYIPVLVTRSAFIEWCTFVPKDGSDVGILDKTVVPGYLVYVSDFRRPVITEEASYKSCEKTLKETTRYGDRWEVKINYHVKIVARNFGQHTVKFKNVEFIEPATYYTYYGLGLKGDYKSPIYTASEITIPPNSEKVIYEGDRQVINSLSVNYRYQVDETINQAKEYYTGTWEAVFKRVWNNLQFEIVPNNGAYETVVGLAEVWAVYREDDVERNRVIGFPPPYNAGFSTLWSYFNPNNETRGQFVRGGDALYARIMAAKSLCGSVVPPYWGPYNLFWPVFYTYSDSDGSYDVIMPGYRNFKDL